MLTEREIRLLELLEDQISQCRKCELLFRRKCLPYWTPISKYLILGEAPDENEVDNEPFVGSTGNKLWAIMDKFGLRKEEFAIINSIQCRPVTTVGRDGKPTIEDLKTCRPWIRKFIRILEPHKILILGNYAKAVIENSINICGIMTENADIHSNNEYINDMCVVYSVHPNVCIYKGKAGELMLEKSIKIFKEI